MTSIERVQLLLHKTKRSVMIAVLLAFGVLATSCSSKKTDEPYRASDSAMQTTIDQTVYADNNDEAKTVADKVTKEINHLGQVLTMYGSGGDIGNINKHAGENAVNITADTENVLQAADKISQLSGGAFDVTTGPLVKAWGIGTDDPHVLSDEQIAGLEPLVDYQDIQLNTQNHTAMLARKEQSIDMSGIGIGYAGEKAVGIYKQNGIKSACINLGGHVVLIGKKPDSSPWMIGIQNPRGKSNSYIGYVKVSDTSVVTTGDYQKYFTRDGVRYGHIIDPHTGKPANSGLISVTIIAPSPTEADPLSNAAFVLGLDQGTQLVQKYGAQAIFVTSDKKIYVTNGLKDSFTFSDSSKEYTYIQEE